MWRKRKVRVGDALDCDADPTMFSPVAGFEAKPGSKAKRKKKN